MTDGAAFPFGKHKGQSPSDKRVPMGYLCWWERKFRGDEDFVEIYEAVLAEIYRRRSVRAEHAARRARDRERFRDPMGWR